MNLKIIDKSADLKELGIMAHLANVVNAKRILEIGTLTGSFSIYMSQNTSAEIDTVDIVYNKGARANASGIQQINFHSEGSDVFFEKNRKKYDFVFIDGDHSYKQSKKDLDNAIAYLKPGGVIVIHDIKKSKHAKKVTCAKAWKEYNREGYQRFLIRTRRNLGVIWAK